MHTWLNFIKNIIFPASSQIIFLENASATELNSKIERPKELATGSEAIFSYHHPLTKTAIWAVKYQGNRQILKNLAGPLYENILDHITNDHALGHTDRQLLIPIPMSSQKQRTRGYNQCAWLAEELYKLDRGTSLELRTDILYKIRHTEAQSHLKHKKLRLTNLAQSFAVLNPQPLLGRRVILLDDVITTGATTETCRQLLLQAGASTVMVFALAH